MKKFAIPLLLLCALLAPSLAQAQGVIYLRKEVSLSDGTGVPYPLVTVCVAGTRLDVLPCSPKAAIFTDDTLTTPLPNPFRGDIRGNIEFHAAPAPYVVSIGAPYSPGYSFKVVIGFNSQGTGVTNGAPGDITYFTSGGILGDSNVPIGAFPRFNSPPLSPNITFFACAPVSGGTYTPGWCWPGTPGRTVSGASDTILATDRGGCVLYTNGGNVTISAPQAGSTNFANNFLFCIKTATTTTATITPTTSQIAGNDGTLASSLAIPSSTTVFCYSWDNANYQCTPIGGSLSGDNTWTNNDRFKGPIPWRDITAYGARVASPVPQTTATCNGTTSLTLAAASTFLNGDGIVAYNCGPSITMTTPNAPTVVSGQSQTLTVPAAHLSTITGSTTFKYRLLGHDQAGGVTLPGPITTIANGPATLGPVTVNMTSESLTGRTLTVVTSAAHNLVANTLVHASQSSDAMGSGWYNVSSITNGTTFVINNMPITASTTTTSTGGSLTYMQGNKLTWTYAGANTWQFYICASRPADAGAWHIIGVGYPYNGGDGGGSLEFTDWGSPLTSLPSLPPYVSDASCTAGSPTNDFLSTTIVSGAGTTSIVTAAAASQTATGTILFDNYPALLSAANAAHAANNGNSNVLIPADATGSFAFNAFMNLNIGGVFIYQQGNVSLGDTVIGPVKWTGDEQTGNSQFQYSYNSSPQIFCGAAYPCLYMPATNSQLYENFSMSIPNNGLGLVWDGTGNNQGGNVRHINFASASGDYSGIQFLVRPSRFQFKISDLTLSTDSSTKLDQTWTPAMWVMHTNSGIGYSADWTLDDVTGGGRAVYETGLSNVGIQSATNFYFQSAIMPMLTLQTMTGSGGNGLSINRIHGDTSTNPILAILGGTGGGLAMDVSMDRASMSSNEAGGIPPFIAGTPPVNLFLRNSPFMLPNPGKSATTYVNLHNLSNKQVYANDSVDTGIANNQRGLFASTAPITSSSGSFVPLATPIMSAASVSAGGTDAVGTNTYCVWAIGWNGGWSASSCMTATLTLGNQTVTLNWSSVPGAQGYGVYEGNSGNKCIPVGNNNCLGISVVAPTTTLVYSGGAGCCFAVAPPTQSADAAQGFNTSGLIGAQQTLYNGAFKTVETPNTLTANRTRNVPDASGTQALIGVGVTPANSNCANYAVSAGVSTLGTTSSPCPVIFIAALTTTAAATDNVTVTGMTSSGHCIMEATNATAATDVTSTYVSAKNTNQITVTHPANAGRTWDILCTPN